MDVEAYGVVVDLLAQTHDYGESIASKLELWISISSGLIVMAYFAPDRLKPGVASLVVLAYVAYTVFVITNIMDDGAMGAAAIRDAAAVAEASGLNSEILNQRISDSDAGRGSTTAFMVFQFILFFGTIGFVLLTAFTTYKNDRKAANDEPV